MWIHEDSHTDHVPEWVVGWLKAEYLHLGEDTSADDGNPVQTFTVTIPDRLLAPGDGLPSALHGPAAGDPPVPESKAWYANRPGRSWPSRLVLLPSRPTRELTFVCGPYKGLPCVLYTAFMGPPTPKEVNDPNLTDAERPASVAFWAAHALSASFPP